MGLDAHQASTVVAVALPSGELREERFATSAEGVRRFVRRLRRRVEGPIVCCYEAGPIGYTLQGMLQGHAVAFQVVAPSLIPHKPGERIKTDRRDARKLVGLLAAGLLTEVHTPTPEQEAIRDLCRVRTSVKGALRRARRLLIEAAWHYRHRPSVGYRLAKRCAGQPAHMIALADRAQQRPYRRYRRSVRLRARGKARNQVVSAVGRELVGFGFRTCDPRRRHSPDGARSCRHCPPG